MQSTSQAEPVSRASLWVGRILSWIVLLFLIFDGVTKVLKASPSVKGTMELGYSEALVPVIGMILLVCVLFYAIPQTKVLKASPSVKGTMELGYSEALVPVIGMILLVCVLFYAIPQTQVLGAILITGYLGGAVASQVRVGKPLFSNELFPIYVAGLVWLALFLQDGRLRALVPFRSRRAAS
jgi:uncharacterized BrkB/YihY/UPF0761 family membrane protein